MKLLRLHATGLLAEIIGTFFIWKETQAIHDRLPAEGFRLGASDAFQAWYYHHGEDGFALLFVGFLISFVCLWLEHRNISRSTLEKRQ